MSRNDPELQHPEEREGHHEHDGRAEEVDGPPADPVRHQREQPCEANASTETMRIAVLSVLDADADGLFP